MAPVTTWSPLPRAAVTAPKSARLSDSVAPDVKMISFGSALIVRATWTRAFVTASSALQPKACVREAALPNSSVKYGSIAWTTRGSTRVVA